MSDKDTQALRNFKKRIRGIPRTQLEKELREAQSLVCGELATTIVSQKTYNVGGHTVEVTIERPNAESAERPQDTSYQPKPRWWLLGITI